MPRDALLLFRLGDFYELFFEDAVAGSRILDVALTKRGDVPMCGIPYHAASAYVSRILNAGRKVAICDQIEEARPGKLVEREVTQIISPGTHFDERMLQAERNNYLAGVCIEGADFGLAFVDLTTGDFSVTETADESAMLTELERRRPAEIIYPSGNTRLARLLENSTETINPYESWAFDADTAEMTLTGHFGVASLEGFGLGVRSVAAGAAGGVVHYLQEHLRRNTAHLRQLFKYECSDFLVVDAASLRHLEILEPVSRDTPQPGSLYGAVNKTVTPMGARRLREWLSQPLASRTDIVARQDAVQALVNKPADMDELRSKLSEIRDLERTITRLSVGSGNARDLVALKVALSQVPVLKRILSGINVVSKDGGDADLFNTGADRERTQSEPAPLLSILADELIELPNITGLIDRAISDEPPQTLKEGGIIKQGFDADLDELRTAMHEGKAWIAQLQQKEIERTGIPSLKVRYNSVFGYYIEVTKSNLGKVPAHYIRKQTISNGERYITPELKDMEAKILGAEERSAKLEYEIFERVRQTVVAELSAIQGTARALASLDVLGAFAEAARLRSYCRPVIGEEGVLEITEGRHPFLELIPGAERFVPNDTGLDPIGRQIALITGPNMAGKSTYIRQTALLALLAHTGSFIPARKARVDLLDRIFTRIGASDDLARGRSTFMVEMSETANILNNATSRSLVVLDEIGRGTSTFDGLSLAWSIIEFIHNQIGAKTLFATHYHELTELSSRLKRVRNFNVAVREWNDQIIFLRKIIEGGCDKSYGIQVARLAGVPQPVIERAKIILNNLEESELTPEGNVRRPTKRKSERVKLQNLPDHEQLDLFDL